MVTFILAAIATQICFIIISMVWVRMRRRDISTKAVLALYIFAVPVLVTMGLVQYGLGAANLASEYWMYILLWAALTFSANFIGVFVMKYASLIEISTYKFSVLTLLALIVDCIVFRTPFSLPMIALIMLVFAGGTLLNFERKRFFETNEDDAKHSTLPLYKLLLLILAGATLIVIELSVLKKALAIQDNFIFHAAASQSILFLMFFTAGAKPVIEAVKTRKVYVFEIALITGLILCAVLLEAYSYAALPVSIIVLMGIFKPLVFSLHDMWTKDMPVNVVSIGSCVMVIAGIAGISLLQN